MFDRRCLYQRGIAHFSAVLFSSSNALAAEPPEVPVVLEEALLSHEPITEHARGRPIPIYVSSEDERITRAVLHYRTNKRWEKATMRRQKGHFRATIPCDAVEQSDTVAYYVDALDPQDDIVDRVGSKKEPLEIELGESSEFVAHFPDEPPPAACATRAGEERSIGPKPEQPERPSAPRIWVSLSLVQDAQVATGEDICSPSSQQDSGYSCFREGGSQYLGTPLPGNGGTGAGLALATTRVLAGLDVQALDPLTLGLRAGYAFGGGPAPAGGDAFLPLHAEARMAYWLSDKAYSPSGFAPYLLLAGGIGQVDSDGSVVVTEDASVLPPPSQLDNPETQRLDAWKKSGVGFASLGAGAFVAVGRTHGILFEIRGSMLFPSPGAAAAVSAGYAIAP